MELISKSLSLNKTVKMISVDEHKRMFEEKAYEEMQKKAKNSRMLNKEQYSRTVERLKALENPEERRTLADFNMIRRFALLKVQVDNEIIEKLVKPGSNLRFVPFEDLFNTIHEAHIEKGHSGRDIMQKYLSSKFCNVTTHKSLQRTLH